MCIPAIVRLLSDDNKRIEHPNKCQLIMRGAVGVCVRVFFVAVFLFHFAVLGYNLYVQGLAPVWIGLLYAYLIWSSLKYVGNYISDSSSILLMVPCIKKYNYSKEKYEDFNFETQYMRSWICSVFQILGKTNFSWT